MNVGDKVKVNVFWGFNYSLIEKEGTICEVYPTSGYCKVKIPLEHGAYRIVMGNLKDCELIK